MSDRSVTQAAEDRGAQSALPDAGPASGAAPAVPKDQIEIILRDQHSNAMIFKVKMTTHMAKVMGAWAGKFAVDVKSLRFIFDGQRLVDADTPSHLEMHNGDTVEVHQEQLGGDLALSLSGAGRCQDHGSDKQVDTGCWMWVDGDC